MPSPVQSQFILNLNQQTNMFQNPLIKEIIEKYSKSLIDYDWEGKTEEEDKTP
jgi:hypothetical protein